MTDTGRLRAWAQDAILGRKMYGAGADIAEAADELDRLREALVRLRDCDWVISLPDRMDAVRDIARQALKGPDHDA
jgi:hypothetical protein